LAKVGADNSMQDW